MKKRILSILVLLISYLSFSSNDKYRLILTNSPSSTITIGWNQISGNNPIVYYGDTDLGVNWASYPSSKGVDRSVSHKGMNNRFVRLSDLSPNTVYYFVIKDSEGTSSRFWFKTAPNTNEKLSFIAGGDSRNNRTPRKNANKLVAKLKPHAVFFGGDMTNVNTSSEWQEWMDDWQYTIASDGRMFPIIPARGNHESSNADIYNLFDTSSTDVYYALTFGNNLIRSYTLNSEIAAGGSQGSWLSSDLSSNSDVVWKMAQYHKPMRPHESGKSEGNDEYNNWAQLFYDNGVRLVCESDSHTVKTTWPVKPCNSGANCSEGFERDDVNGSVYVGEGCWGAPLRANDDNKPWTRDSSSFNQFKLIFVDEYKIQIRTVVVDNADLVTDVDNNNVFNLPSNLNLWNPSNGSVIEIINQSLVATVPDVEYANLVNGQAIASGVTTPIDLNVLNTGSGIAAVDFHVNGNSIGIDTEAPYAVNYNFPSGRHKITVFAYNDNFSAYDEETIYVNVGNFSETVEIPISSGNDDVEEGIDDNGELYYDSSDLELAFDYTWTAFGTNQYIGLRFQNVIVPENAIITNAYIQFVAEDSQSNAVTLRIAAHNSGDSPKIVGDYGVSGMSRTATVDWNPAAWSTDEISTDTRTPSLSGMVQAIVNRNDWKYGNAMSFILWDKDNDNDRRKAYSYDNNPAKAAKLHIEYQFNGNTLKTEENEFLTENVKVYPIPFKDYLFVSIPSSIKQVDLGIYDLSGKLIYARKQYVANNKVVVNTQHLVKGNYYIRISDTKGNIISKLITRK
ncbi:fibronectin type III domain-containing protein [Pseudofulvibacter geojedonensis]|uniref:Fibronectin type III domain-containing protein n=1 Tax=Pseudofulvibacter geojedonensis TaxID=1123758 RepID=A0ABW3HYJ6_9FLAO